MDELQELAAARDGSTDDREATAGAKIELTVDEIIEEHVGALGFSQLLHVFLVSLAWMFDAQNTLATIFADAQPSWRCRSPSCSSSLSVSICGLKQEDWEWVGGDRSSTVAEWGLICDEKFRAGIPASLFFIGSLLGSAAHGWLADAHLGRKKTVLLSCLSTSVTAFLTSLSPNIWVYALLRFSNGFARAGIGICCLVLSTEAVGRRWRGQVGQYGFFFFTVGFLSLPLVAYPMRASWRNVYKVISILPLAYSLAVLPFVSESPRWLAVKGRTEEAMEVLTKLARPNGKKLPRNVTVSNPMVAVASDREIAESLWCTRWATRRMVTAMVVGFGIGFVYYGVQLNVENLNFDLYFTVAVNALMEIPAVFLGSVLLSFTDRRILFSSSACVAGISCILCIFFSQRTKTKGSWSQLTIEAIAFMAASMAFDVLYVYCAELFPTNVRNSAVSMLRQALMLGAAVAPLLVVFGRLSPSPSFLIFGGFAVFSGILACWLPETRDAPLYETLEQQGKEERLSSSPLGEMELVE